MSDLFTVDARVREGDSWRGTVDVELDGEEMELVHRDLYTDELSHTLDMMGEAAVERLESQFDEMADGEDLDESDLKRIQELNQKDDLTDEEQDELAEYDERIGDAEGIISLISDPNVVEALRYASKLCVLPDEEDISHIMDMDFEAQKDMFDATAKTREQARELAEERVEYIIDHAKPRTGFTDVVVGLNVLMASMGGN